MGACGLQRRLASQDCTAFSGSLAQYIVPGWRELIGVLTPTLTPTASDHGYRGGRFVVRKNGNGEGSRPRKRPDGRWEARYWAETSAGKKRRSVYGSTRQEVVKKLADATTTKDDVPIIVPTNVT